MQNEMVNMAIMHLIHHVGNGRVKSDLRSRESASSEM